MAKPCQTKIEVSSLHNDVGSGIGHAYWDISPSLLVEKTRTDAEEVWIVVVILVVTCNVCVLMAPPAPRCSCLNINRFDPVTLLERKHKANKAKCSV